MGIQGDDIDVETRVIEPPLSVRRPMSRALRPPSPFPSRPRPRPPPVPVPHSPIHPSREALPFAN